jgi:nitrogen-specific signal transduction histidine kinase/ActR/RegA family two-component response regulator
VRRVLVALTDVTLRTQAEAALRDSEERLRHAQKMEAVGQLTGGIAHDFNNLLTTIMASLEMLEQQGDLDARGRRLAGHALEGARRAARLTSQLLSFSRRSRLTSETLDPEDVVRGISELLAQSAGNRIALTIDGHEPTWAVTADRNQLESAVLNLVINARDAIAQEGSIRIGFANRPLTPLEAASLRPDALPAGDYVGILVTDTGSGMTPAVLARALEPFFTTKSAGAGTGLGLSQTYGFAAQSGGTLRIDTQPGGGTTVEILLPRADPQALPAEPAPTTIRHVGRGQTIILVEQDALLRHTVSEALRAHGYVVQVAADGPAALALLQKRRAADLLLTDIMIPGGMNGMELARAARGAVPALPILFTAGYSEQHSLAPWPEKADLVSKPFAVDELIRRIAERLSASAAPDAVEAAPGAVV